MASASSQHPHSDLAHPADLLRYTTIPSSLAPKPLSIQSWVEQTLQETSTSQLSTTTVRSASESPPAQSAACHFSKLKRKRSPTQGRTGGAYCDDLYPPLPLKRRFLESYIRTMSGNDDQRMPAKYSNASDQPSEDSKKSGGYSGPQAVKRNMARHNIFQGHDVFNSSDYRAFKQLVLEPFEAERNSGAKAPSVERFQNKYKFASARNESTLKKIMLDLIAKEEFEISLKPAEEGRAAVYGPSDSFNKGLAVCYDQNLRRGYLPHTYNDPRYDKKLVEKRLSEEGMSNGVPDVIWCRDGVTLVSAARRLLHKAGVAAVDLPGPDAHTYIYSATRDTKL